MARDLRSRAAIILSGGDGDAAVGACVPTRVETSVMINPFEFIQQARAEGAKVTWPGRRETLVTTGLVMLMVVLTSLFFLAVDQGLRLLVTFILTLGR